MDKHILSAMKMIDNLSLDTEEEIYSNYFNVNSITAVTADITKVIDEYFKATGENKQDYIDATEDSAWIIY